MLSLSLSIYHSLSLSLSLFLFLSLFLLLSDPSTYLTHLNQEGLPGEGEVLAAGLLDAQLPHHLGGKVAEPAGRDRHILLDTKYPKTRLGVNVCPKSFDCSNKK